MNILTITWCVSSTSTHMCIVFGRKYESIQLTRRSFFNVEDLPIHVQKVHHSFCPMWFRLALGSKIDMIVKTLKFYWFRGLFIDILYWDNNPLSFISKATQWTIQNFPGSDSNKKIRSRYSDLVFILGRWQRSLKRLTHYGFRQQKYRFLPNKQNNIQYFCSLAISNTSQPEKPWQWFLLFSINMFFVSITFQTGVKPYSILFLSIKILHFGA